MSGRFRGRLSREGRHGALFALIGIATLAGGVWGVISAVRSGLLFDI